MTAALAWHEAGFNALAFVALLCLAYVLPQSLRVSLDARPPLLVFATAFLLIGAVSRANLATDQPVSWWPDVVTYAQPVVAFGFLCFLAIDSARRVRLLKEAFEQVYEEFGTERGDRVAAIFRAVRRR